MIPLPGLTIVGDARYLRLVELYDAALAAIGAPDRIRLTMHRPTDRAVALWPRARRPEDLGEIELAFGGLSRRFAIGEASGAPLDRVEDDDPLDPALAVVTDDAAELQDVPSSHAIRRAFQLASVLLDRTAPGLRLRAAELKLDRPPVAGALALTMEVPLASRFWKVGIVNRGARIGHLLIAKASQKGELGE